MRLTLISPSTTDKPTQTYEQKTRFKLKTRYTIHPVIPRGDGHKGPDRQHIPVAPSLGERND